MTLRRILGGGSLRYFVETKPFTRSVERLLQPDSYRALQNAIMRDPEHGAVIPGTGGARKLRWRREGAGKSGGVRVIYYPAVDPRGKYSVCFMLLVYAKGSQDSLTASQRAALRQRIEAIKAAVQQTG
jgi:hypothetical protein